MIELLVRQLLNTRTLTTLQFLKRDLRLLLAIGELCSYALRHLGRDRSVGILEVLRRLSVLNALMKVEANHKGYSYAPEAD